MSKINRLDAATINQIAAGEVVERPASVVKELVENSIDAHADKITVEIKDGGCSYIRVTDNGDGFEADDIEIAFERHTTSKIRSALDLISIGSLGFRGEALSSISSVARVELITKTEQDTLGTCVKVEGGKMISRDMIGCPSGTTFIIRDLFYNVPARKKFLKTPQSEGSIISDILMHMALCRPDISFQLLLNGKCTFSTSGNGKLRDVIYQVYGRDIATALVEVPLTNELILGELNFSIRGYIGKPHVNRSGRAFENYFINGRYIKHNCINSAIEEAYKPFLMAHRFPFTALFIEADNEIMDVNVHPAKAELRFSNPDEVYNIVLKAVRNALVNRNLVSNISLETEKEKATEEKARLESYVRMPEPFQKKEQASVSSVSLTTKRTDEIKPSVSEDKPIFARPIPVETEEKRCIIEHETADAEVHEEVHEEVVKEQPAAKEEKTVETISRTDKDQIVLDIEEVKKLPDNFRIVGQVFKTYWIVERNNEMLIVDQHAAHEKVLYEKFMSILKNAERQTQILSPAPVISFTKPEENAYLNNRQTIESIGYVLESFGGPEYLVREVPSYLPDIDCISLLTEMIDSLVDNSARISEEILHDRVATMACKAAVKGNNELSMLEAEALFKQMFTLDNPYNCPHGRPTTISLSDYELEKKFKRIV